MAKQETLLTAGRHPAESYEEILDSDAVASPDFYREGVNPSEPLESYDTSRYYDPAFFQKEVSSLEGMFLLWIIFCEEL